MANQCSVPNCGRVSSAKGFCDLHYRRLRNKGTTDGPVLAKDQKCTVQGCDLLQHSKGFCRMHAERARKHGDPATRLQLRGESAAEKIMHYSRHNPETGCRDWTGCKDKDGYGIVRVLGMNERQAHRIAYRAFIGNIPDGMHVLHKCDNPGCVNTTHLFLGTNADNMRDKSSKGRHHNARFNEQQIRAIRESTDVMRVLAERYGVSIAAIQQIKERRSYKHIE